MKSEIILDVFKYLAVPLVTKILTLTIQPHLFISVSILREFGMLPHVYILLTLRKKRSPFLPEGTDAHIWQHIHQKD